MHNFRNLQVWEKGVELTKSVYQLTKSFPEDEKFGLITQMRRCAVSIPSNIAEGSARNTEKDFSRFLSISLGSCFELETQLLIADQLKYCKEDIINKVNLILIEVQKMLNALIKKYKN